MEVMDHLVVLMDLWIHATLLTDESVRPTQGVPRDITAIGDPQDSATHVHELGNR